MMNLFWLRRRDTMKLTLQSMGAFGVSPLSHLIALFPLQRALISLPISFVMNFDLAYLGITIIAIPIACHLRFRIRRLGL